VSNFEERVFFKLGQIFNSKTFFRVVLKKLPHKTFEVLMHRVVFPHPFFLSRLDKSYILLFRCDLVIDEGQTKISKFISEDSERPQIDRFVVLLSQKHFWSKVLRSSYMHFLLEVICHLLGQSEVSQFDVSIFEDQKVLGLKVLIDDTFAVQVLQSHNNTTDDKPDCSLPHGLEGSLLGRRGVDKVKNVPSLCQVHHKVI